jgi:hypothetical protein
MTESLPSEVYNLRPAAQLKDQHWEEAAPKGDKEEIVLS